jgi:hypothetical protein
MVPEASNPVWQELVTGKKTIKSSKATLNLLIQSNRMSYGRDKSPANIQLLVAKTHVFFVQFECLFGAELAQILK